MAADLTFDGFDTRVFLTCGGYSGGFRVAKPACVTIVCANGTRQIEVSGERCQFVFP